MQKFELIDAVAAATGLTRKIVRQVFDATDASVRESISKGEEVRLFGLGKISVVDRGPRVASGFRKGGAIAIPARRAVRFVSSVGLDAAAEKSGQPPQA